MGVGTKMIIIMMSITFVLWFSGFEGLPLQVDLLNMSCDNTSDMFTNCTIPQDSLGIATTNGSLIPSNPIFGLYNTFGIVYDFVIIVLNIFFAPVTTMFMIGAPAFITLMVVVIWMLMYLIAIGSFIRGWDF